MRDGRYQRPTLYEGIVMLRRHTPVIHRAHGFTLLEVLITVVLLAFGLLGLATLQSKMQLAQMESYQRGQAIMLLTDMLQRIDVNRFQAASYVTGSSIGTGDTQPSSCTALATGVDRDICEWSNALKGATEQSGGANVGAMIDAQGCITQVRAPDTTSGVCRSGIYRVTVTWQGLQATSTPSLVCPGVVASNMVRALSSELSIGLTDCS